MSDAQSYEWKDYRLNDLGELSTSSVDKKIELSEQPVSLINYMDVYRHDFIGRSMPLMQVTATASEVERFQVQTGDVLFTPSSETPDDIGHAALVTEEIPNALHSYHTVRFRQSPRRPINGRYGGHIFKQRRFREYVGRRSTGSTRYTLSLTELGGAPVSVPPEGEQSVIAQILDTLDTQIRQTEALVAKLETVKQGLLTDLLTRGIDENGQLRSPHEEAPELYKDSPLGPIPMEWEIAFVGDLGEVVTGSTPPSSDPKAWGDAFPFFTPGDVIDYEPMQSAERAISDMGRRHIREIPGGSTLVVCIGSTIGKVGFTSRSGATNQQINAVLPSKAWDEFFVFQAIRTYVHQIHVWAGLQAVPIVNKSTFSQMLVPHPKLEEQRSISEKLRAVDRRIADEREAIRKLFEQKKGLMDDLLTGRVRVTPFIGTAKAAQTSRV
ncbi:restriction endonuclease subunit S [Guyparkeria sp. SCN-R1]|uniref:restriction endonuclease subunit S n=1 Tax=Guyparkeria sp. SCN-R1 TaxID=2341113 RepID=UPI000F64EBF6|nr:restriction endonuclease subunit S [Guyparkeria sp. SCN-R1]RRQ20131.1 restriction endonuclease subunit S [Guyparkeria sp. SCN-R1]